MKKLLLIICAIITIFSLFSCKLFSKDDGDKTNSENSEKNSILFSKEYSPTFVYNAKELDSVLFESFYVQLSELTEGAPSVASDKTAAGHREIIIGKSDRVLSKAAYEKLAKIRREDERDVAYLIYSDGYSIAIAFDEDKYGIHATLNSAFDYIIESAIANNNSFVITAGTIKSEIVDPLAYQEAIDAELTEKRWQAVSEALGEDITKALRDLYINYTDDVIDWFANLYDPAIGGYYYSNSGRDTEGFLPDAESTVQALNFIDASGLSADAGGAYENVLPDWMKNQLISFVKGLQSPENGYFYHPQWGQDYTDSMISRRGRDLNWCCGILSRLGSAPTYDTPSGVKGDGILADGTHVSKTPLPTRLGFNVKGEVSRVLAVSDAVPVAEVAYYLKDKASLEKYLEGFGDFRKNSYKYGDELATIAPEFKARDKALIASGQAPFAVETVINYLNERQNPVTGLWTYDNEPTYEGTNGLLKISSAYNSMGAEINYPAEAARSSIASILTDETPETICYAYNAWFCVTNIITNLNKYSTGADANEKRTEIIEATRAIAVEGIYATAEKLALFRKDDGSFSYLIGSSTSESHGMPVSIPGTNEGDVNATEIAIGGTSGHIFNALGATWLKVPIYTKADRLRYFDLIENLGPVIKHDDNNETTIYDFEEEAIGHAPSDTKPTLNSSGSIYVHKDYAGTNGNSTRYLVLESMGDGGDALTINCDSVRSNAPCYVFESDFYVDPKCSGGNVIQITLGNKAYMLVMKVEGDVMTLMDVSAGTNPRLTNDLCRLPIREWFNLKVEYYPNNQEKVRTKVYLDGELVSVTDNYYDSTKAKLNGREGKPSKSYITAEIYVMSYSEATLYVDNVSSYKTNDIYKAPTAEEAARLNVNIDSETAGTNDTAPGNGVYYNNKELKDYVERFNYNMMGYPMPSFSGAAYGTIKAEGGSLVFTKTDNGETYVQYKLSVPNAAMEFANYCSVFEFDYKVTDTDLSYDNAPFRLDDANYIRFVKNSDGKSYSLGEKDKAVIVPGEWVNLRFETYYLNEYTEYTKIFVDGEYSVTVRSSSMSPFNSRVCIYMKKGVSAGNVIKIDNVCYAHVDLEFVDEENLGGDVEINVGTAPKEGEYFNSDVTTNAKIYDYSDSALPSISGAAGLVYNKDGSAVFMKTGDGETYIQYSISKPSAVGTAPCSVFELDFKFDSEDATGNGNYGISFRFDDNDIIYLRKNSDGESYSVNKKDTANIKAGEWFNLRFEIYNTESGKICKVFVNGTYTSEATLSNTASYNSRLLIYMKKDIPKDDVIYVDNVFIGHVEKSYQ